MMVGWQRWAALSLLLLLFITIYFTLHNTRYPNPTIVTQPDYQLTPARQEGEELSWEEDSWLSYQASERSTDLPPMNTELDRAEGDLIVSTRPAPERDTTECIAEVDRLQALIRRQFALDKEEREANTTGKPGALSSAGEGPDPEEELVRLQLAHSVRDLYYYTRDELEKLDPANHSGLGNCSESFREMAQDLLQLVSPEGAGSWRQREHKQLQDLMQRRLHHLQNPSDCAKAKKLVCDLNEPCGFGCQLHHVLYCFTIAYGTERAMILQSERWRYSRKGWESVFLPLSDNCTLRGEVVHPWTDEESSKQHQVVSVPQGLSLKPRPPYTPFAIPEDLAPRLRRLTGHPPAWFMGQFIKYLLRHQPNIRAEIQQVTEKIGFRNPIVGVHVRRTDKVTGREAAQRSLEEYMGHVDEWFRLQETIPGRIDKRRVYLSTDDPKLLPEARQKFPGYEFLGDTAVAQSADCRTRYSDASLIGLVLDLYFLSHSDYLVCTFSSNMGRLVYEMMQTLRADAADRFYSLDLTFLFVSQADREKTAIIKHKPQATGELALEPGDVVVVNSYYRDGYRSGRNRRTGKSGWYPTYKTVDKPAIVNFPTYPDVR